MHPVIKEFLTTDVGLMSLAVVVTTIGYLVATFMKKSGES
ncbi:MAG: DUF3149 domain-containing protein [Gammaproteobacteria bacterium]